MMIMTERTVGRQQHNEIVQRGRERYFRRCFCCLVGVRWREPTTVGMRGCFDEGLFLAGYEMNRVVEAASRTDLRL